MGWRAVPALLVVSVLVVGACGGDGGEEEAKASLTCPTKPAPELPADLSSLTVDQVYDYMTEFTECPGYVLHATITPEGMTMAFPGYGEVTTAEARAKHLWLDSSANRARWEDVGDSQDMDGGDEVGQSYESVAVVAGDTEYRVRRVGVDVNYLRWPVDSPGCEDSDSQLFKLLSTFDVCPLGADETVTRFEPNGELDGRSMPLLVGWGESPSDSLPWLFNHSYYLDENSLLPLTLVIDDGVAAEDDTPLAAPRTRATLRFDYEFLSLNSLPEDFFDYASIEPDPEDEFRDVEFGITIHWLGAEFRGAEALPLFRLDDVRREGDGMPYRAYVRYRPAGDRSGPWEPGPSIYLIEYSRGDWETRVSRSDEDNYWERPCTQLTVLDLDDRQAVVYGAYIRLDQPTDECPKGPPHRWGAYMYMGDTVVEIDAWGYVEGDKFVQNAYGSVEGIKAIARALVPYE